MRIPLFFENGRSDEREHEASVWRGPAVGCERAIRGNGDLHGSSVRLRCVGVLVASQTVFVAGERRQRDRFAPFAALADG